MNDDPNFWWSELNHGGMFLSPAVLKEFLPDGPKCIDPDSYEYRKLRDAYAAFDSWSQKQDVENNEGLYRWIDFVLEEFLEYPLMLWQKGNNVSDRFKYQSATDRLRPNRVLLDKGLEDQHRFLIKIDTRKGRLGMGKGRVEYSKFLTLLRGTKVQFGVFTNGHQFRLVYAGMDYDCWVEWDATRWFEEESGLILIAGFKALCGRYATFKTDQDEFPLRSAVINSRTRQGELSQVLGEQVRIAVEKVLSSFDKAARTHSDMLDPLRVDPVSQKEIADAECLNALYTAAIRVVMRMVVVLFAEARELLPRNMEKYHSSYGIEGLFASLEEAARHEGEENLKSRFSAWSRLLGLFWAVYEGCSNEDIPIPRYSGSLFKKGDSNSSDPVLRALAVLEDERWEISDFVVLEILRLLKIGKVRVRRGRSSTWVSGPVDFSDLRTEYIGMMYEGLLDYELKQVTEDQGAIVFLNIGQQPALPLSFLERLPDNELKNLIGKLKKEKSTDISVEEETSEESDEIIDEEMESSDEDFDDEAFDEEDINAKVISWAERAVEVADIVKKTNGKKSDQYVYKLERSKAAKNLVLNVFGPDEMYLVRWSGTRKGTGTFYTRPQLAVPTVHRTLEPLVYDKNDKELIPKSPEKILSLKVCDPAMGSASFLVAALRYLTDALYESLIFHKKIKDQGDGECVITLPFGEESSGDIKEELLPVRPDDERFEQILKTRLKRHVVERCIYGVDINNLAVELARLSLWIETMDRELPFEFLAHKLKVGNSLVGCWLDRFEDYPILAWEREGGDGSKGEITKKIKSIYNNQVKPEMKKWIVEKSSQEKLSAWTDEEESIIEIQDENADFYSKLHELKGSEREEFFRNNIQNNEHLKHLKNSMDKWCAVWFWPVNDENLEPLTPDRFYQSSVKEDEIIKVIEKKIGFLHWELEFPDIFTREKTGFDAILGNPPWDTIQPMSAEFFTRYNPIYRTYGKQEAISYQNQLFEDDMIIKKEWLAYLSYFSNLTNWVKNVKNPFGDPNINQNNIVTIATGKENLQIHRIWREIRNKRIRSINKNQPFGFIGAGKSYTYKLFLDLSYSLLNRSGRLGMIVPSSIYTDKGSIELRTLFIDRCRWEWLFGFENRKKIFNIHGSFKFCAIIIDKDGATDKIKTAFMRHDLFDWEKPDEIIISYNGENAKLFSPYNRTIFEINSKKDIEILEKIYNNSVLLGEKNQNIWKINYSQGDFNLTSDSRLFPPITKWLEKEYIPDDYGRWFDKNSKLAIPLFEGRIIGQFDFSSKGWVSGKGRGAIWNDISFEEKKVKPQYLIDAETYREWNKGLKGYKVAFMDVTSSTNSRTSIATILPDFPCGNSLGLLQSSGSNIDYNLILTSVLNSFVYDYIARSRCGGLHLNYFVIEEIAIPCIDKISKIVKEKIILETSSLAFSHNLFSPEWIILKNQFPEIGSKSWKSLWALTNHERLRKKCILDSIIAGLYGLDYDDISWILKNDPADPKGFWRVDKNLPEEIRQTTLALLTFKKLDEVGIEEFCKMDWEFPNQIQDKLGPKYLNWQLEDNVKNSWDECHKHAKNLFGEKKYNEFIQHMSSSTFLNFDDILSIRFDLKNIKKNIQKSLIRWNE